MNTIYTWYGTILLEFALQLQCYLCLAYWGWKSMVGFYASKSWSNEMGNNWIWKSHKTMLCHVICCHVRESVIVMLPPFSVNESHNSDLLQVKSR